MKINRTAPVTGILISVFACGSLLAAPGNQPDDTAGFLAKSGNLPPGRLKTQIDKLPPAAQQRALEWLERFDIPAQDFDFLRVDPQGAIFYADTVLPDAASGDPEAPVGDPQAVAPQDTFLLHSRPGASKQVFLDFDGAQISGTAWNSGGNSLYAKAFDTDGNPNSFSDSERNSIAEIWHRVSEDMAPFDIDVTTEDPGSFGPTTGHVLITDSTDETGAAMPSQNAGGVAYVGVWGESYYSSYQPALVYADNLGPDFAPYIAEAASHEFGHNLGLSHDGTSSAGYYTGHGPGYVSWAPIMGVGYYSNVTQWSQGEYSGANQQQDDVAIISGQLEYRPDDHGNGMTAATPLAVDPDGTLYVTFPEIDPHNSDSANKGVIETRNDVDVFWFDSAAGQVTFSVLPAWEAFYRSSLRGANLDIQASLYDGQGNLVASSDPLNDTMAQLDEYLPAGRYYLQVAGVGNALSPYSDYGSLGMYFISGTVQPVSADTTPPTPSPAGWWASLPAAASASRIDMAANAATDDSGVVQYWFQCTAGTGSGCSNSGWQGGTQYSAAGLTPGATYSFQVKARDGAGNETGWSAGASATTLANQVPVAANDGTETPEDVAVSIAVLGNDTDGDGDALSIASYGQGSSGAVSQAGSALVYTPAENFNGSDSFSYSVTDGNGGSASARVTVSVNPVNDAPVALSDSAEVDLNSSVEIDVLANDGDVDGDTLSISDFSQGSKGAVSLSGNRLIYTRDNKRGGDSFTYTLIDGNGGSATTSVSISIGSSGGGDGGGGKCHPKKGC